MPIYLVGQGHDFSKWSFILFLMTENCNYHYAQNFHFFGSKKLVLSYKEKS